MEKLYIAAHGHQALAMPGNQDSIAIAACVTQADGTPVSGLLKANFKVRGLLTGNVHTANSIGLFIDYGDQDRSAPVTTPSSSRRRTTTSGGRVSTSSR